MPIEPRKQKILVVDDERVIADTLSAILSKAGYETSTAYSGRDAVKQAIDLEPDMVISDVVMPDISGIDAAVQIKAILPDCKVLLFSGQAASVDLLDHSRRLGHQFELLNKPIHPQELIAKLKLVIPLVREARASTAERQGVR